MSQDETAVNDVQSTSATDSAPVETDFQEGLEAFDSPDAKDTEGSDAEETESQEDETSNPEPTDETADKADDEARKQANSDWEALNGKSQDRFRQIANERNEYARQLEELKARQEQYATEQQLLDQINPETRDYYTPEEVARIGAYQRLQTQQEQAKQQAYQLQVRQSQAQLVEDGEKALRDFPQFDATSKEYDAELTALVDPILRANTITDPTTGEVIGMRVSPYQLLKTYSDALSRNSQKEQSVGRAEAQRATERQLASVDHTGGATGHTTEKTDPMFDGFDNPY